MGDSKSPSPLDGLSLTPPTVPPIQRDMLAGPVRDALRRDTVEIVDWHCDTLHGGYGTSSGGVFRVTGTGRDGAATVPWSVVLKVLRLQPGGETPGDSNYWRRELLAYQSGVLEHLPGGVAAPHCFAVVEQAGDSAWLWMEDIRSTCSLPWPDAEFARIARDFGAFNGAYLLGHPLPSGAWVSRSWLRAWVQPCAQGIASLPGIVDHPRVGRVFSPTTVARIQRLWEERDSLLDALERLPQTFCHLDAFPRNLFACPDADGRERTVAVDWAFAGIGAAGEELAPLVAASLAFFEADLSRGRELEAMVLDSYLQGLHDAGWHGDQRHVRFGYTAAAALRYGLVLASIVPGALMDEHMQAWLEQEIGRPIAEIIEHWSALAHFLLDRADEARRLLASFERSVQQT